MRTATFGADTLIALPFYLPGVPNVLVKMGVRVTTAAAGNIRLGIYVDKGEVKLWPHKLLLDAGTVDTGATGVKSVAVRNELPRSLVWVVLLASATPYIGALSDTWAPLGWSEDSATRYNKVSVAQAYGALPDPFPSGGAEGGGVVPYIFLKFG